MIKKSFLNLYFFLVTFILAVSIGRGLLPVWFSQNHFSLLIIIIYYLIKLILPSLVLLFKQNFSSKISLRIALLIEIALMVTLIKFVNPMQILLIPILSGLTVVYFYITYNTLYFKEVPADKKALSSSLYGLSGPVISIIVPLVVGFISQKFGFPIIFVTSALILFICLYWVKYLPKIEFPANLRLCLKNTGKINWLFIVEGIKDAVSLTAIPVFTLLYIKEPLGYGRFFSYLAVISSLTTVMFGYLSDKYKKRTFFLYPSTILLSFSIIILGLSSNLRLWVITTGIYSLISIISSVFVTTLLLDSCRKVEEAMISREFLLGIGRGLGSIACLLSIFYFHNAKAGLIIIGLSYLLFPLLVFKKKIYHLSK